MSEEGMNEAGRTVEAQESVGVRAFLPPWPEVERRFHDAARAHACAKAREERAVHLVKSIESALDIARDALYAAQAEERGAEHHRRAAESDYTRQIHATEHEEAKRSRARSATEELS